MKWNAFGLQQFLKEYPEMTIVPVRGEDLVLKGLFRFSAQTESGPLLTDSYRIEIRVPQKFPSEVPRVKELEKKIPRTGKFHINPDDTLCLGSPLRLRILNKNNPTFVGFASKSLIPFLYGVSRKLKDPEKDFYMGELDHGEPGIIEDYKALFGLAKRHQILNALELLGMKKRLANKKPCPCDCGVRLGRCRTRYVLNRLRKLDSRSWFRRHLMSLGKSAK